MTIFYKKANLTVVEAIKQSKLYRTASGSFFFACPVKLTDQLTGT